MKRNPATLHSLPVEVCRDLIGAKRAVKFNGVLHVSPAMWDLIHHSTGKELEHLLKNLMIVDMGQFDPALTVAFK